MKLISLHAKNIFSIGEVRLSLDDRGLVLVTGWSEDEGSGNMAGKSSVANNAIVWTLYGKTASGVRADDVINTSTKITSGVGEIYFYAGYKDDTPHKITRSRNPTFLKLEIAINSDLDWKDLSSRKESDTQASIDRLLGRDFQTFIQADLFGQGRETPFLSLRGSAQREVIEKILPLNSLEGWHIRAKKAIMSERSELTEASIALTTLTAKKQTMEGQVETLVRSQANWIVENTVALSNAERKLAGLRAFDSGIEEKIKELYKKLPAHEDLNWFSMQHSIADQEVVVRDLEIGQFNIKINQMRESPKDCVTCNRRLPPAELKARDKQLLEYEIDKDALQQARSRATMKRATEGFFKEIAAEIKELEQQLESQGRIEEVEKTVATFRDNKNPFEDIIETANNRALELAEEVEEAKATRATHQEKITDLEFWDQAFGKDLKTLMFHRFCPYLERTTNTYLDQLQNAQIRVRFATVKETKTAGTKNEFCVTASSTTGSSTYALFSGSEKQLVNFAVGLALSDLAALQTKGASKLMILDEPFLYQSPENSERLIDFIVEHLGKTRSTILLISNEEGLRELVSNRIRIIKRKGISTIREDN